MLIHGGRGIGICLEYDARADLKAFVYGDIFHGYCYYCKCALLKTKEITVKRRGREWKQQNNNNNNMHLASEAYRKGRGQETPPHTHTHCSFLKRPSKPVQQEMSVYSLSVKKTHCIDFIYIYMYGFCDAPQMYKFCRMFYPTL